ncbi:MAG TPA: hypothetical protein VL947_04515 [Cytophagales bacterium]|nr:hypothetical protein [Cytophagales bacterium]
MRDVIHKFKFKGDPMVLCAPPALQESIVELGYKTYLEVGIRSKNTLVFVNDKEDFLNFLEKDLRALEPDGVLWFAYPKQSSKIKTDIHRDILWQLAQPYGFTAVSAISIDETWSALRFKPLK